MTSIQFCSCQHKDQDKRYGDGKRVHNAAKKHPTSAGGWRCTVCGREKS